MELTITTLVIITSIIISLCLIIGILTYLLNRKNVQIKKLESKLSKVEYNYTNLFDVCIGGGQSFNYENIYAIEQYLLKARDLRYKQTVLSYLGEKQKSNTTKEINLSNFYKYVRRSSRKREY